MVVSQKGVAPPHSVSLTHATQVFAPSQTPPVQVVPALDEGLEQTPDVQTSSVHSMPSLHSDPEVQLTKSSR